MSPTQQHQIETYLRGNMTPSEVEKFESLMEKDPSFAEQVRFEEKIKQGLSEVRKAELKARLDAIDVSPTWVGGLGQLANSTIVKTVGSMIVASIAGVIIYNVWDTGTTISSSPEAQSKVIEGEIDYPPAVDQNKGHWIILPPQSAVTSTEAMEEQPKAETIQRHSEVANESLVTHSVETEKSELIAENKTEEDFVPQINVPQPGDLAKEEGLATPDSEIPDMEAADLVNRGEVSPVDVKTIHKKNESLKYKYFDGKLFLYGEFNDNPYEILEINGATDRRLFLFYEKSFYAIEITDKVQELLPIANGKLVRELEIIRNNKL